MNLAQQPETVECASVPAFFEISFRVFELQPCQRVTLTEATPEPVPAPISGPWVRVAGPQSLYQSLEKASEHTVQPYSLEVTAECAANPNGIHSDMLQLVSLEARSPALLPSPTASLSTPIWKRYI